MSRDPPASRAGYLRIFKVAAKVGGESHISWYYAVPPATGPTSPNGALPTGVFVPPPTLSATPIPENANIVHRMLLMSVTRYGVATKRTKYDMGSVQNWA